MVVDSGTPECEDQLQGPFELRTSCRTRGAAASPNLPTNMPWLEWERWPSRKGRCNELCMRTLGYAYTILVPCAQTGTARCSSGWWRGVGEVNWVRVQVVRFVDTNGMNAIFKSSRYNVSLS